MAIPRRKGVSKRKAKLVKQKVAPQSVERAKTELVRETAKLAIAIHRDALKELERY